MYKKITPLLLAMAIYPLSVHADEIDKLINKEIKQTKNEIAEELAAAEHANSLLAKTDRNEKDFDLHMQWMNESLRVKAMGTRCKTRYESKLITRQQMESCLNQATEFPDFWLADFTKHSKSHPKEHCVFAFDAKKKPVDAWLNQGCGYNK